MRNPEFEAKLLAALLKEYDGDSLKIKEEKLKLIIKNETNKVCQLLEEDKIGINVIQMTVKILSQGLKKPNKDGDLSFDFDFFAFADRNFVALARLIEEAVINNNLFLTEEILNSLGSCWISFLPEGLIQFAVKNNNFEMVRLLLLAGVPIYELHPSIAPPLTLYLKVCKNPNPSKGIISLLLEFGLQLDGYSVRWLSTVKKSELSKTINSDKIFIEEQKGSIKYSHYCWSGNILSGQISKEKFPQELFPIPFEEQDEIAKRKIVSLTQIIDDEHKHHQGRPLIRLGNQTGLKQESILKLFSEFTSSHNNPTAILNKLFPKVLGDIIAEYWIENHQEILYLLCFFNMNRIDPLLNFYFPSFLTSIYSSQKITPEIKKFIGIMKNSVRDRYHGITPIAFDKMFIHLLEKLLAEGKFRPTAAEYKCITGFLGDEVVKNLYTEVKEYRAPEMNYTYNLFTQSKDQTCRSLLQANLTDIVRYMNSPSKSETVALILKEFYPEAKKLVSHSGRLTVENFEDYALLEQLKNKINQAILQIHSKVEGADKVYWTQKLDRMRDQLYNIMLEKIELSTPGINAASGAQRN